MSKQATLYSFADIDTLAPALRRYIIQAQDQGIKHNGHFRVGISGGSLPKTLAKALLPESNGDDDKLQFDKWDLYFADERAVPLDHEDSNYKLVKEELVDKIPTSLGKPTVYPIDTKHLDDVQELADRYEHLLIEKFAAKDSVKYPIFDLLLMGCGPDGHTGSLFPGHKLLQETEGWVLSIEDSPKPPPKRITLSLPVIKNATKIAYVATGGGKKDTLKMIFDDEGGKELPCGLVNEGGGEKVSWFCDAPATESVKYPTKSSL